MAVEVAGKTLKQLGEERAKVYAEAQAYQKEHENDWSDDRQAKFDGMLDDVLDYKKAIDNRRALADLQPVADPAASLRENPQTVPGAKGGDGAESFVELRDGFDNMRRPRYVKHEAGMRGSTAYQDGFRHFLKTGRGSQGLHMVASDSLGPERYAALQSDDAPQAGYLVASEQLAAGILKEVDDLLYIRRYARIHTVREASSLGIRKRTSRMNTFEWSAELEVAPEDTSLKYGKKILTPHHLTGLIKVSRDLVRRSSVSVEGEIRFEFSRDSGEKMEDAYLLGDGVLKPLGVFVPSADGISTARDVQTGAADNFTPDGLQDAKYALKAQYRRGLRGAVRWLMHRDAIKKVAKLKDTTGQPLFRVGIGRMQDGGPPEDELLGFPVDESERVPNTFTTGQYVAILANWNYYEIADALDMEIQVLLEKYAETNQIGYIGRLKTDGMPTLEEAFVRMITN